MVPPRLSLLFWETTQRCNLSCAHCRMDSDKTFEEIDRNQARFLIDSIAEFASPILVFSGGEPLLREDIFDLATYARDKGLKTALATNGTLVDQGVVDKIKLAGIRRVSISLDGADASTNNKIRNSVGAFEKALGGLKILVDNGVSTQVNASITKSNAYQLERMIKLAIEQGADAIHLFLVVPVGCGKSLAEDELLMAGEYEATLKQIYTLSQKYQGDIFTKVTCAPQYYRILKQKSPEVFEGPSHGMHRISKGCLAGTGVCFVSARGDVYPCGYLPVKAGNIVETSLKEIWANSEVFGALRDSSKLEGACKTCGYGSVCGGCRARAYYSSGNNIMAADPDCILNNKALKP